MKTLLTIFECFALDVLRCALRLLNEAAQTNKPNVVFILIDDMGMRTRVVIARAERLLSTTNIDRLAAGNSFYAVLFAVADLFAVANGSDQRFSAGPMAHYFVSRQQMRSTAARNMADFADPQMPSIARAFKAAGYKTGHFGKWHLDAGRNVDDSPLPQAYGFDDRSCRSKASAIVS